MSLSPSLLPKINHQSQTVLKHAHLSFNPANSKAVNRLKTNPHQSYSERVSNISVRKSKVQKRQKIRNAILESFSNINKITIDSDQNIIKYCNDRKRQSSPEDQNKGKIYKKDPLTACLKDLRQFQCLINHQPKFLIPKILPLIVKTPQNIVHKLRTKVRQISKQGQSICIVVNQPSKKGSVKHQLQIQSKRISKKQYKSIDLDENRDTQINKHNFQKRSSSLEDNIKNRNSRIQLSDYASYQRSFDQRQKQTIQKIQMKKPKGRKTEFRSKKYQQLSLQQKIYDSPRFSRLQQIASDLDKVHKKIETINMQYRPQRKQYDKYLRQFSGWGHY